MTGNAPDSAKASATAPVRCAVIGQPIAHSKSPGIHQQFAAQVGLALVYERIEAGPDAFAETVRAFFAAGGRGLNVTLPHKAAALALADTASERASRAGAANTLGCTAEGRIWADNTDGVGLVRDLARLGLPVRQRRVLVLGAGGAAAGILPALLAEAPAALAIGNRSPDRALALIARYPAGAIQLASEHDTAYDLVISSVSDGAADLLARLPLQAGGSGYDLNYGDRAEPTLTAMRERGLSMVHGGRGMLIEQAAESFRRWHGLAVATGPLHQQTI